MWSSFTDRSILRNTLALVSVPFFSYKKKYKDVQLYSDVLTPVIPHSYPNCVYLSLSDQSALGFELTARLPVRSYSRKNLGYLYAVLHGAKVIFDTDDDNRSSRLLSRSTGLMFNNCFGKSSAIYVSLQCTNPPPPPPPLFNSP